METQTPYLLHVLAYPKDEVLCKAGKADAYTNSKGLQQYTLITKQIAGACYNLWTHRFLEREVNVWNAKSMFAALRRDYGMFDC